MKTRKQTNGRWLSSLALFLIVLLTASNMQAQVTIGSQEVPDPNALLDLKENVGGTATKGLLLPRVALDSLSSFTPMAAHVAGMVVYNTATSASSVTVSNSVSPGFYYNTGTRWEKLMWGYVNWFYMPSIAISTNDLTPAGPDETIDLYAEYKKQFDGTQSTTATRSVGAPAVIPYIPAASDLYYYVTDYDNTVLSITSISATGVMAYRVIGAATDCSYINIVFVLK